MTLCSAIIISQLFIPARLRLTTHIPRTAICMEITDFGQGGLAAPSMAL
jgi:hypothetical protein